MMIQQDRDEHLQNRQDDDLLVKAAGNDIEIGQRQDFNDYELIQEEYLRNLEMTDNTEKPSPPEKSDKQGIRQMSQILTETKTEKNEQIKKRDRLFRKGNAESECGILFLSLIYLMQLCLSIF